MKKQTEPQTKRQLNTSAIMVNQTIPQPRKWREKNKVIPGQAMDLKAIQHKLANNIPVQASARALNTYYRNLDLVDTANLTEQLQESVQRLKSAANQAKELRMQNKREQENRMNEFMNWKKTQENGPAPTV